MIELSAFTGIGDKPRLTSYLADAQSRGATHVMLSMAEIVAIAQRVHELRLAAEGTLSGGITAADPRLSDPQYLPPEDPQEKLEAAARSLSLLEQRILLLALKPERSTVQLTGLST